jgi:hypothetical protein
MCIGVGQGIASLWEAPELRPVHSVILTLLYVR